MSRRSTTYGRSLLCLLAFMTSLARADDQDDFVSYIATLDMRELMKQEVTSVSKRKQPAYTAASAVYVLTQEDIRRSGATTIPDALRLVPGLHVAQIDASQWAVTSRGFNSLFANKLLVLVDGRSVYEPLFAGVYWDATMTVLEDIERIEVIRGPGATVWGANAVNGVINIITKNSRKTQDTLISGGGGTEQRMLGEYRYGSSIGENTFARGFIMGSKRDSTENLQNSDRRDDWEHMRTGFRVDREEFDRTFTLEGGFFTGEKREEDNLPAVPPPPDPEWNKGSYYGGDVLARWERTLSRSSDFSIQTYFDSMNRDELATDQNRNTFDLETRHRFSPFEGHDLVWGLGYRLTADYYNPPVGDISPASDTYDTYNAFVQDQIPLVHEKLDFILGTKLEHNDFDGFNAQPNARLIWTLTPYQSLWAAVSRAVRTSSRSEQDISIDLTTFRAPDGTPGFVRWIGQDARDEEKLIAYELGYRFAPTERILFDLATFYNDYSDLATVKPEMTVFEETSPYPILELSSGNEAHGRSYGGEFLTTFKATDRWELQGWYSYLQLDVIPEGQGVRSPASSAEGFSPRHQYVVRSLVNVVKNVEFDSILRYVDELPAIGVSSYSDLTLRLGWQMSQNLTLSLVGQNLLHRNHQEFSTEFINPVRAKVEREAFVKLIWKF